MATVEEQQRLVDIRAIAERLSVSVSWIYKRVAKGVIPHKKVGGLVRFNVDEVLRWVNDGGAENP